MKRAAVLIVDDDASVRETLVYAVSRLDVDVIEAVHTSDALRLLGRRSFDVVITDWLMPGGGGRRLIEELVATGSSPPIIVVTAAVFDAHEAEWPGWDAVTAMFEKPFSIQALLGAVEGALGRAR